SLRGNVDMRAVSFDVIVLGVRFGHKIDGVFHPRATALFHAQADAMRIFAAGHDLAHALGGPIGHGDDGEASHGPNSVRCGLKPWRMIPRLRWGSFWHVASSGLSTTPPRSAPLPTCDPVSRAGRTPC